MLKTGGRVGGIQMFSFLQIHHFLSAFFRIFCLKFKHPCLFLYEMMVRPAKTSKIMSCFSTIIYFPLYFWVKASGRRGGMTNECSLRRVICMCFDTLERKKEIQKRQWKSAFARHHFPLRTQKVILIPVGIMTK